MCADVRKVDLQLSKLIVAAALVAVIGSALAYLAPSSVGGRALAQTASPSPTPTPASPSPSPTPGGAPSEVFLAFTSPAPSNPDDPCRTGASSKQNMIGDHDGLIVCTFDATGAPAPTDGTEFALEWALSNDDPSRPPPVRFNPGVPPGDTTGAPATADAGIDAVSEGQGSIDVTLVDSSGQAVDSASVHKVVCCHGDPPMFPTDLRARRARRSIRGSVRSSKDECERDRSVTLFRRAKGPDEEIDVDTTGDGGHWRVVTGPKRGVYYARAPSVVRSDDETGDEFLCLGDQSRDVRR
jgi:hypothetical protein